MQTVQPGPWSDPATWGGTVPDPSEPVTVLHDVTVSGSLVRAAAVAQGNATVTCEAGSAITFDTTAGSFVWTQGTANSQPNCKIVVNGTVTNPVLIEVVGDNRFHFDEVGSGAGWETTGWDVQYATFRGIRSPDDSIALRFNSWGACIHRFRNVIFDGCATVKHVYGFSPGATTPYQFTDCRWINTPVGIRPFVPQVNNGDPPVNTAEILRCAFDGSPLLQLGIGLKVEDCVFISFIDWVGSGAGGTFKRNLLRFTENAQTFTAGTPVEDCYMLHDQTTGNPHFEAMNTPNMSPVLGNILDYPHPFAIDPGDGFLGINVGTVEFRRNLVLPSESDGYTSAYLLTIGSNSNGTSVLTTEHNTVCGKWAVLSFIKDPGYHTDKQIVQAAKSNIVYSPDPAFPAKVIFDFEIAAGQPVTVQDAAIGANCTHNGVFNGIPYTDPSNGNAEYVGYLHQFPTSGTPGANDVVVDPQFFDYGRNFPRWAVHKGVALPTDTLRQKIDAGLALVATDPLLVSTDLIPWTFAGYIPTNAAYLGTAHDGTDRGAVQGGVSPPPPPPPPPPPIWTEDSRLEDSRVGSSGLTKTDTTVVTYRLGE